MFTYRPTDSNKDSYIIERNIQLARYLANLLGFEFLGDYTVAAENNSKLEYVFPHDVISTEEARILGIDSGNQIYGSVTDKLYSRKSIFHPPIPNANYIPNNFPNEFSSELSKIGITLPGYTAFTLTDIRRACGFLFDINVVPRVKDPRGASGMMQKVVRNTQELEELLKDLDNDDITRYGIVIEANVVGSIDEKFVPDAYSGGWVELEKSIYSYIGEQFISNDSSSLKKYRGSEIRIVRGHVEELFNLENLHEDMTCSIEKLFGIKELIDLLPIIVNSRYNFDFICGYLELADPKLSPQASKSVFLVDQSFRVGAASIAEFLGISELKNNPDKKDVRVKTVVDYGKDCEKKMPANGVEFYSGVDPIYGPVRTWGALIND